MHADYFTCPGKSRVGILMKRLFEGGGPVQCWPRTFQTLCACAVNRGVPKAEICMQQPCLAAALPGLAPAGLPRCEPSACSCPCVNVLVGSKWVSPSFRIKTVQSHQNPVIQKFVMFLNTSAGLSLLSCFGFAVF